MIACSCVCMSVLRVHVFACSYACVFMCLRVHVYVCLCLRVDVYVC